MHIGHLLPVQPQYQRVRQAPYRFGAAKKEKPTGMKRVLRSPVTALVLVIGLVYGGMKGWMYNETQNSIQAQAVAIADGKQHGVNTAPKSAIYGIVPEDVEGNFKGDNVLTPAGQTFDVNLVRHIKRDRNFYDTLYGLARQGYLNNGLWGHVKPQTSPEFQQYNNTLSRLFDPAQGNHINVYSYLGAGKPGERENWDKGRQAVLADLRDVYGAKLHVTTGDIQWPQLENGQLIQSIIADIKKHPGPVVLELYNHGDNEVDKQTGRRYTAIGILDGKGGQTGLHEDAVRQMVDIIQKETGQLVILIPKCCFSGGIVDP